MVRKGYQPDVLNGRCRSQQVLDLLADKWAVLVVYSLTKDGTLRYSALQRKIGGVSQKMLTQTLRQLERNGLVARVVHPVVPPHVDYSLTDLGRSLKPLLRGLCEWAQTHLAEVERARVRYRSKRIDDALQKGAA